jgi:hypothetical protein
MSKSRCSNCGKRNKNPLKTNRRNTYCKCKQKCEHHRHEQHQHEHDHNHNCHEQHNHRHDHHCKCQHHDNMQNHHCPCHNHHNSNDSCQRCRRFICDDAFRLRLGGLQNGLNYRLRQLIGCEVEIELLDGKKVPAEICFVGSNFVEIKVIKKENQSQNQEEVEAELDVIENDVENSKKRKECHSMIVPISEIKLVNLKNRNCDFCCD